MMTRRKKITAKPTYTRTLLSYFTFVVLRRILSKLIVASSFPYALVYVRIKVFKIRWFRLLIISLLVEHQVWLEFKVDH